MAIDKIIVEFQAETTKLKKELDDLKGRLGAVETDAKKAKDKIDDVGKGANGLKGMLQDLGKTIAAAFAVQQLVSFGREAVNAAAAFDKSMGNIATLVDNNVESMDSMGASVRDLAKKTPVELGQLSSALYDVRSAGISAEDAMAVLESSAQLGVAGLATTAEAANIMTSAVNAFAAEGLSAEQISDILFKTVKAGKTTLAELTAQFGGVAPAAAAAGVSLADLQASTAAITTLGTPAAAAQTQLKQALTEMQKPGKELSNIFKQLGAKDGIDLIKTSGGLGNAFKLIKEEAEASGMTVAQVTGSVETASAILALGGTVNESYTATLADMTTGSNAVNLAFEKQAQTADAQFQLMQNAFEDVKIEIGNALMPVLLDAAEGLRDFMQGVDADTIRNLGKAIAVAATAFGAFKLGTLMKDMGGLTGILKATTGGVQGLSKAVAANPFGLIASAISVLVAYGPDILDMFSGVTELQNDIAEASDKATENLRKEQAELNLVAEALKNTNPGSEQRAKLLQRFNELSPVAIKDLKDEAKFNEQLNSSLKKANESFALRIKLRGAEAAASVASQKQIDVQAKIIEAEQKLLMEGFTETQIKARQGSGALSRFTQIALTLGGQGAAAAAMNEFTELIRLDEQFDEASKSLQVYTNLATEAKNQADKNTASISSQAAATKESTDATKENTKADDGNTKSKEKVKTAIELAQEAISKLRTEAELLEYKGDWIGAKKKIEQANLIENGLNKVKKSLEDINAEVETFKFNPIPIPKGDSKEGGESPLLPELPIPDVMDIKVNLNIDEDSAANAVASIEDIHTAASNVANGLSTLEGNFGSMVSAFAQISGENAEYVKALAVIQVQIQLASAIAAAIAGATSSAATTGPGAPFVLAGYIAAMVGAVVGAFAQTSQLLSAEVPKPSFFEGTPYLQLGGNPKGKDTIPVMAHEGEAIIPTGKNLQYPGLAKSWIDGSLDGYINNNFVRPALMEQQRQAEEDFADRLANSMALQMSSQFDDYRLHRDMKEQTAVLRNGFYHMKETRKKIRGGR
jgi:TP901 family phage tail tape measure protein